MTGNIAVVACGAVPWFPPGRASRRQEAVRSVRLGEVMSVRAPVTGTHGGDAVAIREALRPRVVK